MIYRVNTIKLPVGRHDIEDVKRAAARCLRISAGNISGISIMRRSVDARDKKDIHYVYSVDCDIRNGERILKGKKWTDITAADRTVYRIPEAVYRGRPVIVGFGPAGIFCAYSFVEAGLKPVIVERGSRVDVRSADVKSFWETGVLKPESNVQFGEGGAGTFSDGKLNTLIKDRTGRCRFVLDTFVRFGAPAEIVYDAKPHIGTDILTEVIRNIREYILERGAEIFFATRLTDIVIEDGRLTGIRVGSGQDHAVERHIDTDRLVLAIGHSARDTFGLLRDRGAGLQPKPFAVGFRIEHPRDFIDRTQYGGFAHLLPAAPYKVTAQTSSGRGVYSFCMCPGGYVVNASSEPGHLAVNGMSYSGRKGDNSNAAVIVTVTPDDFGCTGELAGVSFQRQLELRAYEAGNGSIPVQRIGDFASCLGRFVDTPSAAPDLSDYRPQTKGGYREADLSTILPRNLSEDILEGLRSFGTRIPGFDHPEIFLSGIESRTSSPVRIPRGESGESTDIKGLYPCGEGAGYAGGITSAAMDGLYIAGQIIAGNNVSS